MLREQTEVEDKFEFGGGENVGDTGEWSSGLALATVKPEQNWGQTPPVRFA